MEWSKDGDGNTLLFHRLVSSQNSRNRIGPLKNELGENTRDDKSIKEQVTSFFFWLYTPHVHSRPFVQVIEWNSISKLEMERLTDPFSLEEIKTSMFGCDKSKSLGPDGFSIAFYQENWYRIKDDLLKVFREFHERDILN